MSLLEPAVAAVVAVLVLHGQLSPLGWTGLALLLASLVITGATSPKHPGGPGDQPSDVRERAVSATGPSTRLR